MDERADGTADPAGAGCGAAPPQAPTAIAANPDSAAPRKARGWRMYRALP
jgi:hypothetical protein